MEIFRFGVSKNATLSQKIATLSEKIATSCPIILSPYQRLVALGSNQQRKEKFKCHVLILLAEKEPLCRI